MDQKEITRLAYLLYKPVMTADHDAEAEAVAKRVESLQKGLLPEDEFAMTVMWLGNCAAIHAIDQTPMPFQVKPDEMRAPDFLAFPLVEGRPQPVLVEVKSVDERLIDWSEKYLTSLRRFAELVNLPLLVAWKLGQIWTLVEHRHFEKNVSGYRLTFQTALLQDIMCALFRDLRVTMHPDAEMVFDMEIVGDYPGTVGDLIPDGEHTFKFTGVGFCRDGKEIKDDIGFALFLATPTDSELRRTGKQTFKNVLHPKPDTSFTLSSVLVSLLSLTHATDDLNWHQILAKGTLPSSGKELRLSLQGALDHGFIRYVMDIIPNTWPDFLPPSSKPRH